MKILIKIYLIELINMYSITKKWSKFKIAWWSYQDEPREDIINRFCYSEWIKPKEFDKYYNLTIE